MRVDMSAFWSDLCIYANLSRHAEPPMSSLCFFLPLLTKNIPNSSQLFNLLGFQQAVCIWERMMDSGIIPIDISS